MLRANANEVVRLLGVYLVHLALVRSSCSLGYLASYLLSLSLSLSQFRCLGLHLNSISSAASSRIKVNAKSASKAVASASHGHGGGKVSPSSLLDIFVDGSVNQETHGGVGIFVARSHSANASVALHDHTLTPLGSHSCRRHETSDNNVVEMFAVLLSLARQPLHQNVRILSDSRTTLLSVAAVAYANDNSDRHGDGTGRGKLGAVPEHTRAAHYALLAELALLLELRATCGASTRFAYVTAHKGVTRNEMADQLAKAAASRVAIGKRAPGDLQAGNRTCSRACLTSLIMGILGGGEKEQGSLLETECRDAASFVTPKSRASSQGKHDDDADDASSGDSLSHLIPRTTLAFASEVVALDCEMVGVGPGGIDSVLARACVIDGAGTMLIDTYCNAVGDLRLITDYRTWCSGVEQKHVRGAPPFDDVQARVRALLRGKLLVGHQLDSDLKALQMTHPKSQTRDTATYGPLTYRGRPRRLKNLTLSFLGHRIQTSDQGHHPAEDARAALLLYLKFRIRWERGIEKKRAKRRAAGLVADAADDDDEEEEAQERRVEQKM